MGRTQLLTVAAALFISGALSGYFAARHFPRGQTQQKGGPQQRKATEWLVQADFKAPAAIEVEAPNKQAILRFDFGKPERVLLDQLPVTISNLGERPYSLSYRIHGYDSKGRRMSEAYDRVLIAAHETVLREVMLIPGAAPRFASSFRLVAHIEE